MSIASFVVCICGHGIDQHGLAGCGYGKGYSTCPCIFVHEDVLRESPEAEGEPVLQEWRRVDGGKW
jgi:hypothetical protein